MKHRQRFVSDMMDGNSRRTNTWEPYRRDKRRYGSAFLPSWPRNERSRAKGARGRSAARVGWSKSSRPVYAHGSETFLSSSIPDLKTDAHSVDDRLLDRKLGANCGTRARWVCALARGVRVDAGRFADTERTEKDDLCFKRGRHGVEATV